MENKKTPSGGNEHPNWELERRITVALALLGSIRTVDDRWSDLVREGKLSARGPEADAVGSLYRQWLAVSEEVETAVSTSKASGFSFERMEEFRIAMSSVRSALSVNLDEIEAVFADLDANGGIPLGEVVDEIRRRHVKKGA